jgi:hypothetical protein
MTHFHAHLSILPLRRALRFAGFTAIFCLFGFDSLYGQNIVGRTTTQFTANPVELTDTEVSEFLVRTPAFNASTSIQEAIQVGSNLEAHVIQLLGGAPWRPFHLTLGISGYETYFNHPDELFYALSIAVPCLTEPTAKRVKEFLQATLVVSPPYRVEGFNPHSGTPRESYDVPEALRLRSRGQATSAFGIYAFWAYCHHTGDTNAAQTHWPAVQARMKPLLETDYNFDPATKGSSRGEAQRLNGDLAGVIGFLRLAGHLGDKTAGESARRRARQLFELRVNLERTNPDILERSNLATRDLHNARLSRYCSLAPEIGGALARFGAESGVRNLRAFRKERNSWYLAFGDRLIGGENYTNPPHFPRSLFAGATFIEQLPGESLLAFVDVPWCKADLYFIEKCVFALWASGGRPWRNL